MKLVKGIKTESFEDLISQMNVFSSNHDTFASNIYIDFQKFKDIFYGVIYYEENTSEYIR